MIFEILAEKSANEKMVFIYDNMSNTLSSVEGFVYENKEIKKENTKLKVENKQLKNEVNNLQSQLEEKVQVPEPKPHSNVTPHVESYDLSTE